MRDAIARIEARAGGARRRAKNSTPSALGKVTLGEGLALDAILSAGLGRGALHEVVAAAPGDAGAASGFALALAARFAAARSGASGRAAPCALVWIVEAAAARETGAPYAPGLAAHGIDPGRLVLVRTASAAETLWATEEALKCRGLAAVVTDLWRTKAYDLVASRRLALAARDSRTVGILVQAGAPGLAAILSSAARTRFEIAAAPAQPVPSAGHRVPLPGRATWQVRLARIRAGPDGAGFGSFDGDRFWPLAWDHAEARFCDALPFPSPALSGDRPHPQTDRGRQAA